MLKWRPHLYPVHEILKRVPHNAQVLDVWCGMGIMPVLLSINATAKRIVGFDTSAQALQIARSACYPPEAHVEFHGAPPLVAWPSQTFDVVLCIDVLHHLPALAQRRFLAEITRLCAENGRVIFKDIAPSPWWKATANTLHDLIVSRQWAHYRTEATVREWFQYEGLNVVEQVRLVRLWYSHFLLVAHKSGG